MISRPDLIGETRARLAREYGRQERDINVVDIIERTVCETVIEQRDTEPRVPRFPKIASNGASRKEVG